MARGFFCARRLARLTLSLGRPRLRFVLRRAAPPLFFSGRFAIMHRSGHRGTRRRPAALRVLPGLVCLTRELEMGPTNAALVKLFRADQKLREAQARLETAS